MADNITIKGEVIRVVYHNPDNDYFVLKLDTPGGEVTATGYITGLIPREVEGLSFKFTGNWVDTKHGLTFKFFELEQDTHPLLFFLTGIVKGIGKAIAKDILEKYGDNFTFIIERTPDLLLEIKGIGKKKLQWIIDSWDEYKVLLELIEFLGGFGVSFNLCLKIYDRFKNDALKLIKENPYIITQIRGVGFKKADKIALSMGIKPYSPLRIRALVEYITLQSTEVNGNTYITVSTIKRVADRELSLKLTNEQIIKAVKESDKLSLYENKVIVSVFEEFYETALFEFFKDSFGLKNGIITPREATKLVAAECNRIGFTPHPLQESAVIKALTGKVTAIAGYAGTGKTTAVRIIGNILKRKIGAENIVGCAVSGIAARRLEQVTGIKSYTIHALLKYNGKEFFYNRNNKLPYQVVILDEASMVSNQLLYRVIDALDKDTVFIMIGDDAQLPPVGPGDFFHILLKYHLIDFVKLTNIFRQSEYSVLNFYANSIRQGQIPKGYARELADWRFMMRAGKNIDNQEILNDLKEEILRIKPKVKDIVTDIQILAPTHKGILGVYNLNNFIQGILNNPNRHSECDKVNIKGRWYCVGDKVVHLENKDMEDLRTGEILRVFNGTLGIIKGIDHEEKRIIVENVLGNLISYTFAFAGDIFDLAYCLTVHKAQGSEFKNMILVLSKGHYIMLNNQWLYTAITRARDLLTIVGEEEAFFIACTTLNKKKRKTFIDWKLSHEEQPELEAVFA